MIANPDFGLRGLCENPGFKSKRELLEYLLSQKADPSYGLLGICSKESFEENEIKYFLELKSDMNTRIKKYNISPFEAACMNDFLKLIL